MPVNLSDFPKGDGANKIVPIKLAKVKSQPPPLSSIYSKIDGI